MSQLTIKQLLEAGVHFGHQTSRWNPKMKKYIFGERNGIYIINLEVTLGCIQKALAFITQIASEGKEVLFVGTKKQAQEPVREAAERSQMPYVNQRWLGGMLTNFETVRKSVKKLDDIDKMEEEGNFQFVTKKEVLSLKKEREKLMKNLSGIRKMKQLPGAIFVIDSKKEEIAIAEAYKLGIPIVAILDTNADPDRVDYPIPGNDDAIRAIKLFCESVAKCVMEGRSQIKVAEQETEQGAEANTPEEAAEAASTEENPVEEPEVVGEELAAAVAEKVTEGPVADAKDKVSKAKPKKATRKDTSRSK